MSRTSLSLAAVTVAGCVSLVATHATAQQAAAQPSGNQADILITDFECETFPSDWKVTGDAFGTGPVTGPLDRQSRGDLVGFKGKRFANSFHGGEASVGTITLPEFVIARDYINILIGNRGHANYVLLIVNGQTVGKCHGMDVKLGSSETLAWDSIEAREFVGRKATLQIVDKGTAGGGHLNIDDIVQSNTQAARWYSLTERKMPIRGKYLLVPIDNNSRDKHNMRVLANGTLLHDLDVNIAHAPEDVDWWGYLSLDGYQGQELSVSTRLLETSKALKMLESSDEMRHLLPFKKEKFRPQFHFSQNNGWNNDPTGLVYYDGEYHLFWQCNPAGHNIPTSSTYWGHAVSPDMIHWKELPRPLRPNGRRSRNAHPAMAVRSCFSGSANVDVHNTGGWQTGKEKVIVAAFTDTGAGESIAYSNDRGRTFTLWEGNPIFKSTGRDPKLIWYEPGKHWVIMVAEVRDGRRGHSFYTSTNLKQWTRRSHVQASFECPEIFELPVDNDSGKKRWVIFGGDAKYLIGSFDGKVFTPEHKELRRLHWGRFYASQCFSNPPDGRVVQMGWAVGAGTDETSPFCQGFSLPINLTLRTNPDGEVRMYGYPIKEVDSLRKAVVASVADGSVAVGSPLSVDLGGKQLLDINATITIGDAKRVTFVFGKTTGAYDAVAKRLDEMPLPMIDGRIVIRVLIDRLQYELVGNDGAVYKTVHRTDAGRGIDAFKVESHGGRAGVKLKIFEMGSIWDEEGNVAGEREIRESSAKDVAQEAVAVRARANSAIIPYRRGDAISHHERINARVRQGDVDLIMIGDSITALWEAPDRGRRVWDKYYGHRNAANLGVGSDRTQHVLWRLNNGNIANISPKLAVLMIGHNNLGSNSPAEIAEAVEKIVSKLRADLPRTKVLVLAIFPCGEDNSHPKRQVAMEANRLIAKLADGRMVYYLDINRAFLSDGGILTRDIMTDLVHPSEKGYQLWAEAMEPTIARLMGESTKPLSGNAEDGVSGRDIKAVERELSGADTVWLGGEAGKAAPQYEAILRDLPAEAEPFRATIIMRLARARFASGDKPGCLRALDRLVGMTYVPEHHALAAKELRAVLAGKSHPGQTRTSIPAVGDVRTTLHVNCGAGLGGGGMARGTSHLGHYGRRSRPRVSLDGMPAGARSRSSWSPASTGRLRHSILPPPTGVRRIAR